MSALNKSPFAIVIGLVFHIDVVVVAIATNMVN